MSSPTTFQMSSIWTQAHAPFSGSCSGTAQASWTRSEGPPSEGSNRAQQQSVWRTRPLCAEERQQLELNPTKKCQESLSDARD